MDWFTSVSRQAQPQSTQCSRHCPMMSHCLILARLPPPRAQIASWKLWEGQGPQQGKGWRTALLSWQEGMAAVKCKDHFVALFPFNKVLKAPGTVLISHVAEHKQQTFGRVLEPNLLLQGPLPLWCLCHTQRSLFQPSDERGPCSGLLPLVIHSGASGANSFSDWRNFQSRSDQLHTRSVCSLHWQSSRETCIFRPPTILPS